MKLSENIPKLMGQGDGLQMDTGIASPLLVHSPTADLPLVRRNTLPSTSALSDTSKTDTISSTSEILSHCRRDRKSVV